MPPVQAAQRHFHVRDVHGDRAGLVIDGIAAGVIVCAALVIRIFAAIIFIRISIATGCVTFRTAIARA
jgi:hypothetical protein